MESVRGIREGGDAMLHRVKYFALVLALLIPDDSASQILQPAAAGIELQPSAIAKSIADIRWEGALAGEIREILERRGDFGVPIDNEGWGREGCGSANLPLPMRIPTSVDGTTSVPRPRGNFERPLDPVKVGTRLVMSRAADAAKKSLQDFLERQDTRNCSKYGMSMRKLYERMEANYCALNEQEIEIVRNYDKYCVKEFRAAQGSQIDELQKFVGVLYDGARKQFVCSGTRVTSRYVLTARHCLPEVSSEDHLGSAQDLLFFAANSPSTPFRVRGFLPSRDSWNRLDLPAGKDFDSSWQSEDYIFLETEVMPPIPSEISYADAFAGDTLTIVAPSFAMMYQDGFLSVNPSTQANGSAWLGYLRYDPAPTCQVIDRRAPACLYHACQTAGGMSGAGIFRYSGNRFELVGVHIGSPYSKKRTDYTCSTSDKEAEINLGRAIGSGFFQATGNYLQ